MCISQLTLIINFMGVFLLKYFYILKYNYIFVKQSERQTNSDKTTRIMKNLTNSMKFIKRTNGFHVIIFNRFIGVGGNFRESQDSIRFKLFSKNILIRKIYN